MGNGYYHFCTDGWKAGNIFNTVGQYAYGMILIGLITLLYGVKVYEFILMPNHIHMIIRKTDGKSIMNDVRTFKTLVTKQIGHTIWQSAIITKY